MKIANDHVMSVCRSSTPGATCSYLTMSINGWECAKGTPFEDVIHQRREAGTMNAMGDNCQGPPDFKPVVESDPHNQNDDGATVGT